MYTYLQGKSDLPAIAKVSHVLLLKLTDHPFCSTFTDHPLSQQNSKRNSGKYNQTKFLIMIIL